MIIPNMYQSFNMQQVPLGSLGPGRDDPDVCRIHLRHLLHLHAILWDTFAGHFLVSHTPGGRSNWRGTECVFFSNGHVILVGGWATPLKNMSSSVGIIIPFIPNIWEILKHVPVIQSPPTRSIFYQWRSQSGNQLHGCKTTRFEHVRWMKQKKRLLFFW